MAKVMLLTYTPEPEKTVAAAAKLCYSNADIETLMDGLTPEKTQSFVAMLSEIGHESPIEHASFTFGIEGVSRALLAQITRHRIASYSVQSQRYVRKNNFEYIVPPEIDVIPEAREEFLAAMKTAEEHYEKLAAALKDAHTKRLIEQGIDPSKASKQAEKQAIEDARFVLPNACDTRMIVTMNARSLHNFFAHRCCNRAQWEIREVAEQMLALVLKVAPNLFAAAGPPCLNGACPEGKMSCQKAKEVREKYSRMKENLTTEA
ncbi:FAD-dependent thymidylate synthase [Acetanaerobacterium elongatum]|uniref:Flavin-dependent thymidylate synthase n=1 Tax=Acetanaerobacterium elongatum TaxID=258515 RepID=A0A1H0FX86_9FIRM|nr:FAD-dependent thymidylate synthase [Acetanaerobacterium elongatum]SDN99245.1 thymidylate synthase (FAD) [Acetanaerobacterium elongatum]